jgi:serine protease Do
MYEEQNYQNTYNNTYNSTMNDYGAAPNRNPADGNSMDKKSKKTKSHPILKRACSMVASGVAFGLAASLVFIGVVKMSGVGKTVASVSEETEVVDEAVSSEQETTIQESSNKTIPATNVSQTQSAASISDIVEMCMPSIVSITNTSVEELRSMFGTRQYETTSAGSGIIIGQNEEELLIATNNHVVSGSEELSVCFDDDEDKVVEAKVKGTDANNDLAIIAVKMDDLSDDIKSSISIATLGNSDELNVGDQVIAIGNALGYGQSVTTGIVSAKDREVTIDNVTAKLIQTDAAINPGNSGGALLNMNGEVIGINSSKFASTQVEGMGYAIPISTAQPILENLMSRETRDIVNEDEQGYLGISCQNVSEEISEMYNIPQGVYVLSTDEDGAAAQAGIQKGDIITTFDGISISDYNDLKDTLQYYQAGENVKLIIQRAGSNGGYQQMEIEITLGKSTGSGQSDQQEQNKSEQGTYGYDDLFKGFFNDK